ncbi:MAG: prolyl oligopeptidase family serine peptidase, partial [Phycisphaerales bacterium]
RSLLTPFALVAAASIAHAQQATYPATQRGTVTDNYHGTDVADPFRWLEEENAPATREWINAQNDLTKGFLKAIPAQKAIEARITKLWNYEKFGTPGKEAGKYFYSYNTGLQPQSVLYVADKLGAEGRVLINPNDLSTDGTAALSGTSVSDDGKYIAYGVAEGGSDWNTWRIRDIATGKDTGDILKWVKFSGASWTKDSKGFFYQRYDAPSENAVLRQQNKFQKVYYHVAGEPQEKDTLVYDRPDEGDWGFGAGVTDDGRFLVMDVRQGTDRKNRFYYRDLKSTPLGGERAKHDSAVRKSEEAIARIKTEWAAAREAKNDALVATLEKGLASVQNARKTLLALNANTAHGFVELLNDFDASYDFIDNDGPVFYFTTDLTSPRGRVIAIDTTKPARENWKEIIPESEATLTGVSSVGNHLICQYLKDAASQVKVFDLAGKPIRTVDLPGIGTAGGFGGKRTDTETFYSFTGYTTPPTIYSYDVASGKSTVYKQAKVDFDPAQYETKQVFYTSKDGTKVPMFISHKKGLALDGSNPTLLYGYGGFNISLTPGFSVSNLTWMEMGGIYCVANLRGGGEYGEQWHQAGTKLNKQNVFDDFIGAAEWHIANKYTSPKKLAIQGGSNGGLLVGACMAQRPELFGAALPAVGVMDMLRFHLFTIGHAWRSDYGSSESPDQFAAIYKYSPYHQMLRATPATRFPATLVTTGDHDDRVVPGHSFKFAAALQDAGSKNNAFDPTNPLLIR